MPIIPLMPSAFFYLMIWTNFQEKRVSGMFLLLLLLIEFSVFNANSVAPDQMLRFGRGLDCLPMTPFGDIRHQWVKLSVMVNNMKID